MSSTIKKRYGQCAAFPVGYRWNHNRNDCIAPCAKGSRRRKVFPFDCKTALERCPTGSRRNGAHCIKKVPSHGMLMYTPANKKNRKSKKKGSKKKSKNKGKLAH